MTEKEFRELEIGDIVIGPSKKIRYIVTGHYGNRVIAVRTVEITNPPEWELIDKVTSRLKIIQE